MTDLKFDDRGLIPAIVQDRLTGEVRMVAWMNQQALDATRQTGLATFYSRSRQRIWQKGETSGHSLRVHEVVADCDADVLLLLADPVGPSCHTGRRNCFFRRQAEGKPGTADAEGDGEMPAVPHLFELEQTIQARATNSADRSYTRKLLDKGAPKIGEKLREEADELARAVAEESAERVASEAADVLYHLLVGLRLRDVELRDVVAELARRSGVSGLVEKASRDR